jgi:phage terminase large subunit
METKIAKPKFRLHQKQKEAFLKLTQDYDCKEVLFGGAKNGGKSFLGAGWIFSSALMYPDTFYFIARKEVGQLRAFTIPTIMEWFKTSNIDFNKYCTFNGVSGYFTLYNGSRVYLIACTHYPRDPLYERFGSMQFTQGWIEEGGEVPEAAYDNLKLSVGRWNNDKYNLPFKLLITCNPKKNWMYNDFYKPWRDGNLPKTKYFVQSLVTDNIYRQSGSIEVLDSIKDKTTLMRLRYGEWEYSDTENALMSYDAIQSIFTNTFVKAEGRKYIISDIARFGNDKTIIRVWHGYRVIHVESITKKSTKDVAQRIKELCFKFGVQMHNVLIDEDGVGGGVIDQLTGAKGFIANSSPVNVKPHEAFDSLKSQCAYKIAEMINDGMIYEPNSEHSNDLIADLEQIKEKNVDHDGKRGIVPKQKMKQVLGRSPDNGDTYIMRAYFEVASVKGFNVISPYQTGTSNGRTI